MKKHKRTTNQIKLDKEHSKEYMANIKPREKATECFKRAPYAMNKEVKPNE